MNAEHINELADTISLSEAQIEAYLHWMHADDNIRQSTLASKMAVSQSTFSKHLSKAKTFFEDSNDDTGEALHQLLLRTSIGSYDEIKREVVDVEWSSSGFAVVTHVPSGVQNDPDSDTRYRSYRLHIGSRDLEWSDEFNDEMPETMTLPDRWELVSLTGDSYTEVGEHAQYYFKHNDMNIDSLRCVFHILSNHDVEKEWLQKKVLETL